MNDEQYAEATARGVRSQEWLDGYTPREVSRYLPEHFHFTEDGPACGLHCCFYNEEYARKFTEFLDFTFGEDFFQSVLYAEDLDLDAPLKELGVSPEEVKEALSHAGADIEKPLHWNLDLWQPESYTGVLPDPKLYNVAQGLIRLGVDPMNTSAGFIEYVLSHIVGEGEIKVYRL